MKPINCKEEQAGKGHKYGRENCPLCNPDVSKYLTDKNSLGVEKNAVLRKANGDYGIEFNCIRCNDNGCPACDGTKGSIYNSEPY